MTAVRFVDTEDMELGDGVVILVGVRSRIDLDLVSLIRFHRWQ